MMIRADKIYGPPSFFNPALLRCDDGLVAQRDPLEVDDQGLAVAESVAARSRTSA
jgi:hypothetical protein